MNREITKEELEKFTTSQKWLTCGKELLKEFTQDEIEKAIIEANLTLDSLTDKTEFEHDCYFEPKELIQDWHTGTVKRYMVYKGKQWETTETTKVRTYRVRAQFQGLKHGKIIYNLLKNRFPWFTKFKWSLYEMSGTLEKYEIYMETKKGSLYVPIMALLQNKPWLIKERMNNYFKWYYKDNKEQLDKHLAILEAKETKELIELIKR